MGNVCDSGSVGRLPQLITPEAVSPGCENTDISTVTLPSTPALWLLTRTLLVLLLTLAIRDAWQLRAVVFSLLRSTVLPSWPLRPLGNRRNTTGKGLMVDGWVGVNKANFQAPDSVFNPGIQEGGSS